MSLYIKCLKNNIVFIIYLSEVSLQNRGRWRSRVIQRAPSRILAAGAPLKLTCYGRCTDKKESPLSLWLTELLELFPAVTPGLAGL